MNSEKVKIKVGNNNYVSGVICIPDRFRRKKIGVIIAHGAGNDMNHHLLVVVSEKLAREGFITLRFNFLYKEKGKKAPDSQKKLILTWSKVYDYLKNRSGYDISNVIAIGKSMGGRVASQMVADGLMNADRLIFLGYPLHAPGKKDKLRDSHLYNIKTPMLFFAGTRDTLCDLEKLNGVLNKLNCRWELEVINGGDHSFKMLKSDPRADTEIDQQVILKCLDWLKS